MQSINKERIHACMTKCRPALLIAVILALCCVAMAGCNKASASDDPSAPSANTRIQVPNVVALERPAAMDSLKQAGFDTIEVLMEYSDTVAQGVVISQKPAALSKAKPDTVISITVSRGKQDAADVTVPDLKGMSLSEAEQALAKVNLVPVPDTPVVDTSVEPGKVCKQSVKAGTSVKEGTKISFATALAEAMVEVPSVEGKSYDDAKKALSDAGLAVDPTSAYSSTVEKDKIISQSVPAKTKVAKGTVVKVTISLGPQPVQTVQVPYILTANLDEAIAALKSAGLEYRYSGDVGGTVSSVSPEAGTEVPVGSTVTFVLENAATSVAVPDLAGMTGSEARAACDLVGLSLSYDVDDPDRVISGSMPDAGTLLDKGSIVIAVYSPDPGPEPEPGPIGPGGTNPWTEATTAEEAAQGAGLESFSVAGKISAGGKTLSNPTYSFTSTVAQATYGKDSVRVLARKGTGSSGPELHGDYNNYPAIWSQDQDGITILCAGDEQGAAKLVEWSFGGYSFSATVEEASMSADEVAKLVKSIL